MFSRYVDVLSNLPEYSKNVFRKGYFKWLFNQLKGWGKFSYVLLAFNFILQLVSLVQSLQAGGVPVWVAITGFIGGNLSVLCVLGISNKSGIQGWAGALSAICIAATALFAKNYASGLEQIGYLIFLDLFCILDPKWNDNIQAEKFDGIKDWIKYILFFVVVYGILFWLFGLTNDPRVPLDSLNLAMAITGSLLELNRKREQFFIWSIASVFTIALWIQTMVQGDGDLSLIFSYSVFFLNDMYAFFSIKGWFRGESKQQAIDNAKKK